MSYNAKNYTEQGGEKTVIGGTLEIKEGASVTGLPSTPTGISAATDAVIGGIIAATKTAGDTVEGKICEDNKLYVPTYPVMPAQAVADNQTDSIAVDAAGLVTDFNALLAKLKTAGLMTADLREGGGEMTLLEKLKQNLIISYNEDDALLTRLLAAAVSYAEGYQHLTAGTYSDPALMSNTTEQAVIMLASHLYESRDASTGGFFADKVDAGKQAWNTINNLLRQDREWKV